MIGAGGGLAYLGLWAAAGPYGLLERRIGVLLLAACTVVVTVLALRHEVEGLAIWALAGAYLAPILLPPPTPNPEARYAPDRKSTRLNSSHGYISYAVFCLKKKTNKT